MFLVVSCAFLPPIWEERGDCAYSKTSFRGEVLKWREVCEVYGSWVSVKDAVKEAVEEE